MPVQLRRTINTGILIGVVGVVVILLRLLLATFAEFITYIYIAFVFVVVLYRVFTFLPRQAISLITRAGVVGIMLGLAGMIQPFSADLFRPGFYLLLLSTITYSVVSYVRPTSSAAADRELIEELPVSINAAENTIPTIGGSK